MLRELFTIPGINLPINGFGTMVLIGVLAGLWALHRNARVKGLDPQLAVDVAIWMVLSGLLGARLFYVIQFWEQFAGDPVLGPFKIWNGGLVVYGSVIGGFVGFLVLQRRYKFPLLGFLDAVAPSIALGIGFGRIGCLFNGCCWGKACHADFPLGITFPADSPPVVSGYALVDTPLQPAQLYASVAAFLIAAVVWRTVRTPAPPGTAVGLVALLYGITRFTLENVRGDHQPAPGQWPVSQSISVFVMGLGVGLLWAARRRDLRASSACPPSPGAL